jgi:hypothetical protein
MLQKKELQIYRESEFKANRDAPHSPPTKRRTYEILGTYFSLHPQLKKASMPIIVLS